MALGLHCLECDRKMPFMGCATTHHKQEWISVEACWLCRKRKYLPPFLKVCLFFIVCVAVTPWIPRDHPLAELQLGCFALSIFYLVKTFIQLIFNGNKTVAAKIDPKDKTQDPVDEAESLPPALPQGPRLRPRRQVKPPLRERKST